MLTPPLFKTRPRGLGVDSYLESNIMTAGHLKSWELLLDRAVLLCAPKSFREEDNLSKAQNIVSQVQQGLNLETARGRDLYKVLGVIWDGLESRTPEAVEKSRNALQYFRDTIELINK